MIRPTVPTIYFLFKIFIYVFEKQMQKCGRIREWRRRAVVCSLTSVFAILHFIPHMLVRIYRIHSGDGENETDVSFQKGRYVTNKNSIRINPKHQICAPYIGYKKCVRFRIHTYIHKYENESLQADVFSGKCSACTATALKRCTMVGVGA